MKLHDVIAFATDAHAGQTRRFTGKPYVSHPISVYRRLKSFGISDQNVLSAALLHDTIEDTDVTYDSLVATFNREVADIVMWLTNPGGGKESKTKHIQHILRAAPYEVVVIKIMDRIDNLFDAGNPAFLEKYRADSEMMLRELSKRGFTKLTRYYADVLRQVYAS